jgi:hypothetical protein
MDQMTYPDKKTCLQLLTTWRTHYNAQDKLMNDLHRSPLRLGYESEVFEVTWATMDALTAMTALVVGDKGGWLEWFSVDNKMGAKKYPAGYDGQLAHRSTLLNLYDLIVQSRSK